MLVVNKDETRTVVDIFRRYLALKSVRDLQDELAGVGIRSKRRGRPDGTKYGGQKLARGALYLMLQNRIYTLLRLPWLAPNITTAIVNGRQPQHLNAKTLMRKAERFWWAG
jgi:hypothetical protein